MQQLNIPFESAEAEELAAKGARSIRLTALEAAALAIGIKWDEVGGRVLRALGHLCGSRRQIEAGLTGLRWAGSVSELADDKMVQASTVRVRCVLARFEEAGILDRQVRINFRGQVDGLILTLNMAVVNRFCTPRNRPLDSAVDSPLNRPLDSAVDSPLNRVHHRDFVYIDRIPEDPNTPPPPKTREVIAPLSPVVRGEGSGVRGPAAEVLESTTVEIKPVDSATLAQIESDLRSIGIERAKPMAMEFATRAEDVSEAVQVYRAHRTRFSGPGAVADFLRNGAWPADGIKTLKEIREASAKAEAKRREAELERRRYSEARSKPMPAWSEQERKLLQELGVPV